jgi:probable HAF family extracellular repeat protein
MRSVLICVAATIFGLTTVSLETASQEQPQHHHYKLFDLGSFGGPGAPGGGFNGDGPSFRQLNARGMSVGALDTATLDPNGPNNCFFDCYVDIGFLWKDGVIAPLRPLPGGENLSSYPSAINNFGQVAGAAENGAADPLTGWPGEVRAVLWERGQVLDLGTLGGNESSANSINDYGQIVGAALTATPDPFANAPLLSAPGVFCGGLTFVFCALAVPGATETHAVVWQNSFMRDLGTLGGPDSFAWVNNDRGEVAGESFISFNPNLSTGVPTVDPFFWSPEDGKMTDLGGLGGTFGHVQWLNNRGQVVGASNLPGDQTEHPFIWSKSTGMVDLFLNGGLGGDFGHPDWVNDIGEVVGFSLIPSDGKCVLEGHGFLWRNGVMTDLGTVDKDPTSEGNSINLHGQVVGGSYDFCSSIAHGFLWENGGPAVDLNTLVLPGTTTNVIGAEFINDRGEIACTGTTVAVPEEHPCMLIPCDESHPGIEGCDYGLVEPPSPAEVHASKTDQGITATLSQQKLSPAEIVALYRQRMLNPRLRSRVIRQQ